MKRITKLLVAAAFVAAMSQAAHAADNDALTVTITPNAFYAVDIDTENVSLDMGTVALSASTQTVSPSTVTVQSTYAQTDLKLQGAISGGWSFDTNSASNEQDALATWATFTTTARSSAPAQGGDYFAGTTDANNSDLVTTTNRYVGSSASDSTTNRFENSGDFDLVDMDARAPSFQSHLWLYFRLPNATTTSAAKNVTVTLTAVAID